MTVFIAIMVSLCQEKFLNSLAIAETLSRVVLLPRNAKHIPKGERKEVVVHFVKMMLLCLGVKSLDLSRIRQGPKGPFLLSPENRF